MAASAASARRMPPLPTLKDILRMYKIGAKKSLSQNFIMDPRVLRKIARLPGKLEDKYAIEIGPGPGGITRAILAENVKELHVIEKDPRFLPSLKILQESVRPGQLKINIGDCLHYNVQKMFPKDIMRPWDSAETPPLCIIGNLPFNVATPYLIRTLKAMSEKSNAFYYGRSTLVLTFQHEVALRMVAPPNDRERCRLSVVCQNWAQVDYAFQLPGGAFVPAPQVDVGVVKLEPFREPYIDLPFAVVNKLVTAIFIGGKNKRLRTSLATVFREVVDDKQERLQMADKLVQNCGLHSDRTAVSLTMEEIKELCFAYDHLIHTNPYFSQTSEVLQDYEQLQDDGDDVCEEVNQPKYDVKF